VGGGVGGGGLSSGYPPFSYCMNKLSFCEFCHHDEWVGNGSNSRPLTIDWRYGCLWAFLHFCIFASWYLGGYDIDY
jgi:hypothetical protein